MDLDIVGSIAVSFFARQYPFPYAFAGCSLIDGGLQAIRWHQSSQSYFTFVHRLPSFTLILIGNNWILVGLMLSQNVAGRFWAGQLRVYPLIFDVFHDLGDLGSAFRIMLKNASECTQQARWKLLKIIGDFCGFALLILFKCSILCVIHPVSLPPRRISS